MKIAIIGTGIAGNVAAWHLCRSHDVTVFEANDYIGGHTHTHDVVLDGQHYKVDTGFIVFNYRNYPHFAALLAELGVDVQPSDMSFSVRCERTGLEYKGHTLNTLFAQRRNLLRPAFHRMVRDILRFNREAPKLLAASSLRYRPEDGSPTNATLGEVLHDGDYSQEFIEHYLIPMGASIWSTDPVRMFSFPAEFFIRFLHNHGMLDLRDRPRWHVIRGGSNTYVKKLTAPFSDRIRTCTPVQQVMRHRDYVTVKSARFGEERFDEVILACHSDEALRLLVDPSSAEQSILGAIPYQANEAVLHTDERLLPRRRLAHAAWNYHIPAKARDRVALTYNMNILQSIEAPVTFCVTLNDTGTVDPNKVISRMNYAHPLFTPAGVKAQSSWADINGNNRTWYCGAWWGNGFHEDGVVSALKVITKIQERQDAQLPLRRAS